MSMTSTSALALGLALGEAAGSGRFRAQRVSHSYVQTLAAGPEAVLPLLSPLEEMRWAEGWEPQMIHPIEGEARPGSVFITRHGGAEAVWVLTLWDVATRSVGYVHFTAGSHVTEIRIRLDGPDEGPTRATVSYTWTGLSEAGNARVATHTRERYEADMREWEASLNHYLKTGRRLEQHER